MQKGLGIIGIIIVLCLIGFLTIYFTSKTTQQMTQETGFKFLNKTIGKTAEVTAQANLKIMREAIAKYYAEHKIYPYSIDNSGNPPFVPTYLITIPPATLGMKVSSNIRNSNKVTYGSTITNTGGWLYNPNIGKIMINYDGLDSNGVNYSSY